MSSGRREQDRQDGGGWRGRCGGRHAGGPGLVTLGAGGSAGSFYGNGGTGVVFGPEARTYTSLGGVSFTVGS